MCFCWFLRLCFWLARCGVYTTVICTRQWWLPLSNIKPCLFRFYHYEWAKYEQDIKPKLQKSSSEWIRATNVNQLNPLWILWGIGMSWLPKRGRFASSSFELGCKQLQSACFKEWSFSPCFRLPKTHRGRMSSMMSSMYLQFLFHPLPSFAAHLLQAESSGGSGAQFGCLCTVWFASKLESGENMRKWCR